MNSDGFVKSVASILALQELASRNGKALTEEEIEERSKALAEKFVNEIETEKLLEI